ncbi:MAG: hypothetical protein ACLP5V_15940 [Candidatus Bathyarchaeia archaeon]
MVTMEMDALYEGIARRKVSLAVVVVILILVLGPVVTWVAEANGWINLMANLTELFLFGVLLPSFSFASGLIVYLIGHRKQNVTEENKGKRTPSERLVQGAVEPNLPKHLKYRGEVRTDLLRIHQELYGVADRKNILFDSWDVKTEPDFHNLKHRLIAIKEQDDAIEAFSSNLNIRNKHLDDDQFEEKNDNCIARYVAIRETGFFDLALEKPQPLPVQLAAIPLKPTKVVILITSTASDEFDIGVKDGKLADIEKWEALAGNVHNKPISHENYFTVNPTTSFLRMKVKATFLLPPEHAIGLLRKEDAGHLTVKFRTGYGAYSRYRFISWLAQDIGEKDHETSPNPKNETIFELKDY